MMKTLRGSILVVDDDPDIRDILSETLNSLGARVITAANGQECLDKVDKEAPELVFLDIEMPVKNGLEVLKELRRRGARHDSNYDHSLRHDRAGRASDERGSV